MDWAKNKDVYAHVTNFKEGINLAWTSCLRKRAGDDPPPIP